MKLIVSGRQASLAGCVQDAITGRTLTHPFIVAAYAAAVMTGEEVEAAAAAAVSQSQLLISSSSHCGLQQRVTPNGMMTMSTLSEDCALSKVGNLA